MTKENDFQGMGESFASQYEISDINSYHPWEITTVTSANIAQNRLIQECKQGIEEILKGKLSMQEKRRFEGYMRILTK